MSTTGLIPNSWPFKARENYTPVKPLGKGGFGAVWLAESKSNHSRNTTEDNYVAIKLVGHAPKDHISSFERHGESGYFHREALVLRELSHPHIVKLIEVFEQSDDEQKNAPEAAPFCMILSYGRGPTLEHIIEHGGAPGIHMAREVGSQLVDAIAYLHTRAVLHRDIKPDNVIVSGADLKDEACWSDDLEGEDAAKGSRWNILLVDFGFARPLHPDDIENNKVANNDKISDEPEDAYFGRSTIDGPLEDLSISKKSKVLDRSISRTLIRGLSAVGNRSYAAPELLKGVRMFPKEKRLQDIGSSQNSDEARRRKHEVPLTECVSDYGMTADAYSLGCTLRYMLTGVPPGQSIDDFISEKNSLFNIVGRKLNKRFGKNKDLIRKKKYRYTRDLPTDSIKVVQGLTHWNEVKRTTVRSARNFDWIAKSYSLKDKVTGKEELQFLKCSLERKL